MNLTFKYPKGIIALMVELSVCMITKNEEALLEDCLQSINDIIDELIIVDTGSTDNTKEIAKKYNAKMYDFKWIEDFSAARNESLDKATKEWILVVDADEIITKEHGDKIKEIIKNADDNIGGFKLRQQTYVHHPIPGTKKNDSSFELTKKYSFYIQNNLVRLFRNNKSLHFRHKVHELIEDSITEQGMEYRDTDIIIHHFGSLQQARLKGKEESYSRMIFAQLKESPSSPRYNYQAARMYLGKKDVYNALTHFKKTAELNPSYKSVLSDIAKIYLSKKNYEKAVYYFKKSIEQKPENLSPVNNLAVTYMFQGEFKQAAELLWKYLKLHPSNRALQYNYQQALQNQKNT